MRNRKWMVMLCATVLTCGMTVNAAPFDAAYYAAQNPDVVAAVGNDAAMLELHYNTFGAAEGRMANAEDAAAKAGGNGVVGIEAFDAAYYAAQNPDVAAIYGDDVLSLYTHYVNFGAAEGRAPSAAAAAKKTGSSSENPYARFAAGGSSSGHHSKSKSSSSSSTSSNSDSVSDNSVSDNSVGRFTGYNGIGITGPDELKVGDEAEYNFTYHLTEEIPEGFRLYAAIDDWDYDADAVTAEPTDGGIRIKVNKYSEKPITLTGVFAVDQGTSKADAKNIIAHEEYVKTITIVKPDEGTTGDSGNTTGDAGNTTGDAGDTTGNAGDTTGDAGDTTGDSGNTTGDAGNTTGDAGDTTGDAGDTAGDAGDTTGDAGDTTGDAGSSTGSSGDEGASEAGN